MNAFLTLFRHRRAIEAFVRRDIRGRYANSVLGLSWAVVQPIILLVLYTFVFSVVLNIRLGGERSTASFAVYLFCGMLPWLAFSEGVTRSAHVILEHVQLIKKVVFPSEVLPAYVVASAVAMELVGLAIFLPAAAVLTGPPGWTLVLLPVVIALQFCLTLGLGWMLAALNVFLRDVGQLLAIGLTVWLFVTPIFYPPELMPPRFRVLLVANPMYHLVQAYRAVLLEHRAPESASLLLLAGMALSAFAFGGWFFRRLKHAFVDVL